MLWLIASMKHRDCNCTAEVARVGVQLPLEVYEDDVFTTDQYVGTAVLDLRGIWCPPPQLGLSHSLHTLHTTLVLPIPTSAPQCSRTPQRRSTALLPTPLPHYLNPNLTPHTYLTLSCSTSHLFLTLSTSAYTTAPSHASTSLFDASPTAHSYLTLSTSTSLPTPLSLYLHLHLTPHTYTSLS